MVVVLTMFLKRPCLPKMDTAASSLLDTFVLGLPQAHSQQRSVLDQ
jgi:hypothetical protein